MIHFLSLTSHPDIEHTIGANIAWPQVSSLAGGKRNGGTSAILYSGCEVVHYYIHTCWQSEVLGGDISSGYLSGSDYWPAGFEVTAPTQVTVTLTKPPTILAPGTGVSDWFKYKYAARNVGSEYFPVYSEGGWAMNEYFERIGFDESRFLVSRDRYLSNQKDHDIIREFWYYEPDPLDPPEPE